MSFITELKRRNVFRVGIAYVLIAWVFLQAADFGLDLIDAPNWLIQALFLLAALGLPAVLAFSWVFEMTPEGLKLESEIDRSQSVAPDTGRKLDRVIIGALVLAVAALLGDRLLNTAPTQVTATQESSSRVARPAEPSNGSKSIAVLPFVAMSSGPDDEFFADGLTEEILNSLTHLPRLLVTARTSAFHFKGKDIPIGEIAQSLGVDHVVEGSVRRSGDRLRVTVQLIRADDGFHLWSETYDETTEDTIAVQEDIAEKIAGALDVIMDDHSRNLIRQAGLRDVEAFISLQKGRALYTDAHGADDIIPGLREANRHFELAFEKAPEFSLAYMYHSDLYTHILLDNSAGISSPSFDENDVADALEFAVQDFTNAARYTLDSEAKDHILTDLALLSGDWNDLDKRISHIIDGEKCVSFVWIAPLAWAAQEREKFLDRMSYFRSCDPFLTTSGVNTGGSAIWSGNPARALAVTAEGNAALDHDWVAAWHARAQMMNGQFDAARTTINLNIQSKYESLLQSIALTAAQGKQAEATALAEQWQTEFGPSDYEGLTTSAWLGDREAANRHAAAMDGRPLGYLNLFVAIYWCTCGAPFDLEAAPVFAQKIKQSGVDWPPPSPIDFPLKTWP